MTDIASDPYLWIALSFLGFVLILLKFGLPAVLKGLDTKIALIKADLAAAERLHHEAREMLVDFQDKQSNALSESARIVDEARAQAASIRQAEEAKLADTMARREAQMKQRIEQMEKDARAELSRYATELALKAAEEIIAKNMSAQEAGRLIDSAIRDIPSARAQ